MAFYIEVATFNGKWAPQRHEQAPVIKTVGSVERLQGGPRVRAVTEIPSYFEKLTLDQLREVFSPDGNFYNMNRKG